MMPSPCLDRLLRRSTLPILASVLAASCGSDGSPTNQGQGSIAVSLQPSSLGVTAGQSGTVTLTLSRSGGFTGAITLSVEGLPTGATGSFAPASVSSQANGSQLTIAAAAGAQAGSASVVVRASGQGVQDATATLALTIQPAGGSGSFAITLDPASATVPQGGNTTSDITISRTNLTGPVALSVSGGPSGVTATVSPASASGNSATLSVAVGAGAAVGSHTLTVTGQAPGLPEQTATFALTVSQATGPTGPLEWNFCASNAPIWLAYQDGAGDWAELPISAGTTVPIPITQTRGGVAYVVPVDNPLFPSHHLVVHFGTIDELRIIGQDWCITNGGGKQVTGSVAGLQSSHSAYVTLGVASMVVPANQPTFTLTTVPDGPRDLIASRVGPTSEGTVADKYLFRRNLDPADGAMIPVIDFGGTEAFDPVTRNVTVANTGGSPVTLGLTYFTAEGTPAFLSGARTTAGGAHEYPGVPAARQESGDLHILTANIDNGLETRGAATYFHAATDLGLTVGPPMAMPTVSTVATTPYARLQTVLPVQPEYDGQIVLGAVQAPGNSAQVTATAAYYGALPANWVLAVPDLSAANFDPSWGPQSGTTTVWTVSAFGWDTNGTPVLAPFDGLETFFSIRGGTVTP